MVKGRTWPRWWVAPLGQKRANTGCTKTTPTVLSETEIPCRITHPDIIQTQCCLTLAFECFASFVSLELSIKLFINYLKYRSDWSHSTNLFHWTNAIEHGEVVELKHECLSRINDLIDKLTSSQQKDVKHRKPDFNKNVYRLQTGPKFIKRFTSVIYK